VGPWLGGWLAVAGMVSAFALFNALLLVYSRIPLVLAQDGLVPGALAATDARGTPRNAVLVSAVAYSVFALLPFGGLLAGDVLLYSAALALEFAALVRLRRKEPGLRGAFRVRSEEHTSELQSRGHLVCRLLLEKKKIESHAM